MGRNHTKRVFRNFNIADSNEQERYLTDMAAKGWYLAEISEYVLFFNKGEKKKVRYAICFVPKQRTVYREYCEKAGWNYVCEYKDVQIYRTEELDSVAIESDESVKFEVINKKRNNILAKDFIKLAAICISTILLYYYVGLARMSISVYGQSVLIIIWLYGILVLLGIVDTVIWKNRCRKAIIANHPIQFEFSNWKRRSDKVIYIGFLLFYIRMFFEACMQFFLGSVKKDSIDLLIVQILVYVFMTFFIVFRSRNYKEQIKKFQPIFNAILLISVSVITWAWLNGVGDGSITYPPETLNNKNDYGKRYKISSGIGTYENYRALFLSQGDVEYAYSLYQTKVPGYAKWLQEDLIRTQGLQNYLELYDKRGDYSIYVASNHKRYPEYTATVENYENGYVYNENYENDLEYYEQCIFICGTSKTVVFYYSPTEEESIEQMVNYIISKL